jgi:maltooligosyltrehalose trehalohydrolase
VAADHFVVFAQNHDQVGNRAKAERLVSLVGPDKAALAAAVLLLSPFVPLLFMGEEYAEPHPFPYFVDHHDRQLLDAVRQGRAEEFGREADELDPASASTFDRARLDRGAATAAEGATMLATYRSLIAARKAHRAVTDPAALETSASVIGNVLTVCRRTNEQSVFVAYNFSDHPAEAALPATGEDWSVALHSDGHDTTGDGVVRLKAFGFALFVAEPRR